MTFSDHFAGAQPRAVRDRQRGLVLQVAGRLDESPHFIGTEHDGQYAGHAHRVHPDHQLGPVERDCEEELQASDRVVQRYG